MCDPRGPRLIIPKKYSFRTKTLEHSRTELDIENHQYVGYIRD